MSLGCHKFLDEREQEIISPSARSSFRWSERRGSMSSLRVCVCVFLQSFVCSVVFIRSESMMSTMITATCVRYARVQVPASRWLFCWRDTDAGKLNSTGFACIYSQQRQVRLRIDFCCCCCCYINLITKNCFIQRNLISPYFYFSFLHCSTYNCSIQQNLHINLWRYFVCDYKH